MYDIVIIGAGPAGATLARLLGDKYKILIIDKRQIHDMDPKGNLEKCCGGLLAPDAQQMLAKFGLCLPQDILIGPQLFTVRTIDFNNDIEQYYQRHYINVNREKFDRWLISLISPEVKVVSGAVFKGLEITNDNIKVNYTKQGMEHAVNTKFLVGADGAFSMLRRKLSPGSPTPKTYMSIQEYYKMDNTFPYYSAIFDGEITDFYSWTIPKGDLLVLGTAIKPKDNPHQKFNALKEKLIKRGYKFGPCVKRNGAYLLRPEKLSQIYLGYKNVALIGEAAGWISPSSAEGLSYAFRSAYALAGAIQQRPDDIIAQYHRNTSKLRLNIKWKHCKSIVMYNSFLRKAAMKSGLMSMDIISI